MTKLDQKFNELTSQIKMEKRVSFFLMETNRGNDLHFFSHGNMSEIRMAILALAKDDPDFNRILKMVVNEIELQTNKAIV